VPRREPLECDPSVEFGPRRFALPVVPANMKTVVDEPIVEWLAANGFFYVMHRFDVDNVAFARRMRARNLLVSISSGVKRPDYAVIDRLASEGVGADYVTIDIAHGHADTVQRMIEHIKTKLPDAFVIAGNVATPEAVIDLENWGADATKVGVGPGQGLHHQAEDRLRHRRLAALGAEVVRARRDQADHRRRRHPRPRRHRQERPLRRLHGDDRLALRRPRGVAGRTVEVDGKLFKEYYGSASDFNKGEYKHVEGKRILEPIKGRSPTRCARCGRRAELDLVRRRHRLADVRTGQLRHPRRRQRRRAPADVTPPRSARWRTAFPHRYDVYTLSFLKEPPWPSQRSYPGAASRALPKEFRFDAPAVHVRKVGARSSSCLASTRSRRPDRCPLRLRPGAR
jgi:GMP reductase